MLLLLRPLLLRLLSTLLLLLLRPLLLRLLGMLLRLLGGLCTLLLLLRPLLLRLLGMLLRLLGRLGMLLSWRLTLPCFGRLALALLLVSPLPVQRTHGP